MKAFLIFGRSSGDGDYSQMNLEYLSPLVFRRKEKGKTYLYPDTLVGTDSHTTMINGLGVLGWGVGGIEAEAAMLGQPVSMLIPEVVGFKLTGKIKEGVTITDVVLTITQMLRQKGVVGKIVEFFGPGVSFLPLADRAVISNMAPEYGATAGYFPADDETIRFMRLSGRAGELIKVAESYLKEQGLFRENPAEDIQYSDTLELDLKTVDMSLAGPRRPQDRVALGEVKTSFEKALPELLKGKSDPDKKISIEVDGQKCELEHGAVVIASITSCTNTSSPSAMLTAGLLAEKAALKGLSVKPWVKTSLAPGSQAVTDYLRDSGLLYYLEKMRFHLAGYGCMTCIGNSGPLPDPVAWAVREGDMVVASVLSGNRNFEGRVHAQVKANYLASPALVVAYAIAGKVTVDLEQSPLGTDKEGNPVFLKDIWPSQDELSEAMKSVKPEMYRHRYRMSLTGASPGRRSFRRRATPSNGTKNPYVKHRIFRKCRPVPPKSGISGTRGRWRCWATRSRPITFRRQGRSGPTAPRENI